MILVTAFEPFGGKTTNASLNILNQLADRYDKLVLPVDVKTIRDCLYKKDLTSYDMVIMLGEADRPNISLEQFAYNELTMRIKDNQGYQVFGQTIIDGGQTLMTPLQLDHLLDEDTVISTDPGRYLCNMGYYLALNKTENVVFIHVSTIDSDKQTKRVEAIIYEIEQVSKSW